MRAVSASLLTQAALGIALCMGHPLSAATPLWELRAQQKQAATQTKPSAKSKSKGQPLPSEAPRVTSELERVMGKDARTLVQLLGQPVQDVREAAARKLQFATNDCVLDAYLYAPSEGRDAVVTYVAARVADGRDAERNSCITALRQKR